MNWLSLCITLVSFIIGFLLGFFVRFRRVSDDLLSTLEEQEEKRKQSYMDSFQTLFSDVTLKSMQHSSHVATDIAKQTLVVEQDKVHRDVADLNVRLKNMMDVVQGLEKDRSQKFGELTSMIQRSGEETRQLNQVTSQLHKVLASSQSRGQWGERLADDLLRTAGFVEGVNFARQVTQGGCRPDYTFFMPCDLQLNMDVKFPIDNYARMISSEKHEAESLKKTFLKDVKARVKEVSGREYIHDKTVDCVLMLIPNEQVYAYLHQAEPQVFEDALRQKVIVCSPLTLFAVLAVIRQAVDHFSVEKTAGEILEHMSAFRKQWDLYQKSLETMGRKLEDASAEYQKLTTTRDRMLVKTLDKIDSLKEQSIDV
ncbi:MAG: DNA recombination protein RmuC [Oligoflexales bacterium]